MALSGVRSSWLMLARNSLLALLAPSARIFSVSYLRASSASCAWLCSRLVTASCSAASLRRRASSWRLMAVMSAAVSTRPPSAVRRSEICSQRPSFSSTSRRPGLPRRGVLPARWRAGRSARTLVARGAGLQQPRLEREEAAVVVVAHQQPAVPVPQHEGLRDAVDGVAQPGLGGLGAGLGHALLGDVERHPDDPVVAALARRRAPGRGRRSRRSAPCRSGTRKETSKAP